MGKKKRIEQLEKQVEELKAEVERLKIQTQPIISVPFIQTPSHDDTWKKPYDVTVAPWYPDGTIIYCKNTFSEN